MLNKIVLKVNGQSLEGWKSVQVNQGLNQMAGTFGFSSSDKFPKKAGNWGIKIGQSVSVEVDGQVISTGYIDGIPISYTSTSHSIQFVGRDITQDLIDCSYVNADDPTKTEWKNTPLSDILKDLAAPFGIKVVSDDKTSLELSQVIESLKVAEGAKVSEMIRDICQIRGLLPISLGDGNLTITRSGTNKTFDSIQSGKNVKTGRFLQDNKNRYSDYFVKGQGNNINILSNIADYTEPLATLKDNVIKRYRPLTILPEKKITNDDAEKRVQWEARNRAGKSKTLEYQLVKWTQSNGEVWPLNSIVKVKDDFFDIETDMLISRINFNVNDEDGTTVLLTIVPVDTYNVLAEPIEKERGILDSFA